MERLDLPKIPQVILDDHTYLRVGDIIQGGVEPHGKIEVPIMAVIESQTDPLLNLYNLSGAHCYGNVLLGDNLSMVERNEQQRIIAQHSHHATEHQLATLKHRLKRANSMPSKNLEHYYNIVASKTQPTSNGSMRVMLLLTDHQAGTTNWCYRTFKPDQKNTFDNFMHNAKKHQTLYGQVTTSGWIKYLYPCNH